MVRAKGTGAKAKMARLQNRKENSCEACGDDLGISTCGFCGGLYCKDCKIDHECARNDEDKPARKSLI